VTVRIGTATWNYPGWRGIVYPADTPDGMPSADRLALYVQTRRYETVEADFTFYRPQNAREWKRYAAALPKGFPVVSKVWEEITCERFPQIERQGDRAGKVNPHFLDVEAFKTFVLKPAEEGFADNLGPFVFEFRRDWLPSAPGKKKFRGSLDGFLGALPKGHRYAIELRTPEYFDAEHVALLREHGASHVLNWWTHMPPLSRQFEMEGVADLDFLVSRILVAPGRDYADAVKMFTPYDRIRDAHPEMRADAAKIAKFAAEKKKDFFLIVNNRAEGSAPYTINAIRKMLGQEPPPLPEPGMEDVELPF
jgi:uncharacterized protein YecE (DUF72 family)